MQKRWILAVFAALVLTLAFAGAALAAEVVWSGGTTAISNATRPAMLYDGTTYHLWYVSGTQILHATSSDCNNWGSGTAIRLNDANWNTTTNGDAPYVLKAGSTYYMFNSDPDGSAIKLYTSTDGVNWTGGEPVFNKAESGAWDAGKIDNPMVIYDGTTYKMYYQGYQETSTASERKYQIGLAESASLTGMFTRVGTAPVLAPSESGWDSYRVFQPWVVKVGGDYYMWYAGQAQGAPGPDAIGFAFSSDGKNWTKGGTNPVAGAADTIGEGRPSVVAAGEKWDMLYLCGSDIKHATGIFGNNVTTVTWDVTTGGVEPPVEPEVIGVDVPDTLDLGDIAQGATATGTLTIKNTGNVAETFSIEKSAPSTGTDGSQMVTVTPPAGSVPAGGTASATVKVTVPNGTETGSYGATLTVTATKAS